MALTLLMLRSFAVVAETGNLQDAAGRLGRTPSAVSMTLKHLEAHLGARLFETDRKNRLTPLGQEVFDLAQHQVRQFDESVATIETLARTPKGVLRVASIPSAMHRGLPSAVEVMMARHPALKIEIRDADTENVKSLLVRGQAEIGIVSGSVDLNGFARRHLFEDPFGLVTVANHPLMRQAHAPKLRELDPASFVHNNLCAQIASSAFQTLLQHTKLAARNTLSLMSMVRSGRRITVLPAAVVGIMPETLAFRTIADLDETRVTSLLVREKSLFPDLVAEFAEVLSQQTWFL